MKINKVKKVMPMFREFYRGKKWVQMCNPVSNQPLLETDSIQLRDLEKKNIMIFETRPHGNYRDSKKNMFQPRKIYYEEE